ncbi:response regulator transcription factor [Paenibacillus abyssi]|uniref:DNA-binding response regulator n=1 Tax=Paenibacillus abyssi TaxID=1340531 RepID=A0A917FQK2_9BACL|nr:response regulator [Paenibacillus abyssi]GGF99918.1 DNA-binding response regulator [Paenibacillus abyssi]
MYKVLLVDDERIILEGIAAIVDWSTYGTELIGTARNGIEAMAFIEQHRPDIVISDIKMPGMDGLQLVEHAKTLLPEIEFIMLSGFGEFDYAKKAMHYGVKHYLLKPCSEELIGQAIAEVVDDLQEKQSKQLFLDKLQAELIKVLPSAKEQFLKELVTNKMYGRREWEQYRSLFGISVQNRKVRLLLCQLEGEFEFEHLFALKNIAEDILTKQLLILSTTMGNHVLLLVNDFFEDEQLLALLGTVKQTFTDYYKLDATIAVSEPDDITKARYMYLDTLKCLKHRFYLGEGSLITVKDITIPADQDVKPFLYDDGTLCMLVKSGDWEGVRQELDELFKVLSEQRMMDNSIKADLIPIYIAMIRQADPQETGIYLKSLAKLDAMNTLHALREFIEETAKRICTANYENQRTRHTGIIAKVMDIIDENLGNPSLSLQWVAGEILYMNADYLGKLFKKETGEKFSNFVMRSRMDKAIEHIGETEDVKVFELAEMLGFGDNPQYFSQVFKKYTGFSPSEYKKA